MALTTNQKQEIYSVLKETIQSKLKEYSRESKAMPFLSRLMQDNEKVASYSFIHSIATTLGMSLYEQISVFIAQPTSKECDRNVKINGVLSKEQKSVIASIVNDLREGTRKASISKEANEVLKASPVHGKQQKDGNIADFYMKRNNKEHYFEIKTVKPNIDVFVKSKTKLLEWIARKQKKVKVFLAFPYNPYAPEPYSRFTEQNMMDHPNDFLVAEEYWDFLGGKETYSELLEIFDNVGNELKKEIHAKIKKVAKATGDVKKH